MGMTQAQVITFARQFVRNGQDSSMYPDGAITNALTYAADEWCRIIRAPRKWMRLVLSQGSKILPELASDWTPAQHLQASIWRADGTPINTKIIFVDLADILSRQVCTNGSQGTPTAFGVNSNNDGTYAGQVDITPDTTYTLELWYWVPLLYEDAAYNVPDEHLRTLAALGVPAYLQMNEPENQAISDRARAKFLEQAQQVANRGEGHRGGDTVDRMNGGIWRAPLNSVGV